MARRGPTAASQLGLFEIPGEPGAVASAPGDRTWLDETSWIEHHPAWFADHERAFAELAAIEGWERRQRWMYTQLVDEPRMTAEYPVLAEAPAVLQSIGASLSARYEVAYDRAWLNLYCDHQDSTAWHGDRTNCKRDEVIVPVLSLGATRRFLIRPKDGGASTAFVVHGGDLIVMGGRCQRDWVHAVPKEIRRAGPRISVNFGSSAQAMPAWSS